VPSIAISRPSSTTSGTGALGSSRRRRTPNAGTSGTTSSTSNGVWSGSQRTRAGSSVGTTRTGRPSSVKPGGLDAASASGANAGRPSGMRIAGYGSSRTRTTSVRACGDGLKTAIACSSDGGVRRSAP
jgi:hypothetical protein